MRNLASFSVSLNLEPLAFKSATRYPNSETNLQRSDDRPMSLPSLVKLGARNSENRSLKVPHPLKLHAKHAKSSIIQPRIVRFRSNFVRSLNI